MRGPVAQSAPPSNGPTDMLAQLQRELDAQVSDITASLGRELLGLPDLGAVLSSPAAGSSQVPRGQKMPDAPPADVYLRNRMEGELSAPKLQETGLARNEQGSDILDQLLDNLIDAGPLEVTQDELGTLAASALEILPMETLGVLFGEQEIGTYRLRRSFVAQNVKDRDAMSVTPGKFSQVVLRRFQAQASGYKFMGSYHSHP